MKRTAGERRFGEHARIWATLALTFSFACAGQAPTEAPEADVCPPQVVCLRAEQLQHARIAIAPVHPSQTSSEVLAGGHIDFDDLRVSKVASPLSGRVAELCAALGEHVARDAPLLRLHAPQMGSILATAAGAIADEVAARRDFDRQRSLFREHAVAAKEFEAAQNRLAQTRATAEQARQRRAMLGASGAERTDTYTLRSPIEGNIIARNVAASAEVQGVDDAGSDAPALYTVGSLDSVWIIGEAFAIDAASIETDSEVAVRVTAYPQHEWHGKLDWLAASVDAATATVRVRARLDNPNHLLKPGMTATLRIKSRPQTGLWLPPSAVFRLGEDAFVFIAAPWGHGGQQFLRRRVRIARVAADGRFLLSEGLSDGESVVVTHGILLAAD